MALPQPPRDAVRVGSRDQTHRAISSKRFAHLIDEGADEPLAHALLREAEINRNRDALRSALILAVAAIEIGVKRFIATAIPGTAWLLEQIQSPPTHKLLSDYLPTLPAKQTINRKARFHQGDAQNGAPRRRAGTRSCIEEIPGPITRSYGKFSRRRGKCCVFSTTTAALHGRSSTSSPRRARRWIPKRPLSSSIHTSPPPRWCPPRRLGSARSCLAARHCGRVMVRWTSTARGFGEARLDFHAARRGARWTTRRGPTRHYSVRDAHTRRS